jgi:transglutaminase-like putative cysteine protease
VSRLEFRTAVALPRPRAAVLMVALATGTLAITGQVAAPALALAALVLGFVGLAGEAYAPWRASPWLLNAGLAACVAVGGALWARGALVLVALAHFAVLVQALQLLDARPRRSEFLLVALAVFQVTMAANLTDSAWYPLLLVAFSVSCVWTLVVHTLRAEALEAGELGAAQRILSVGLWRTTLAASLASVLFSALLFPILPRIRSGAIFDQGFGRSLASAGFSDRVELGDIGRIRQDPSVALRVETLEGELPPADRRYWRGLAFDHFDGRRWSIASVESVPVYGDPEIGVDLAGPRKGARLVQRIAREEMSPGVVFAAGFPTLLRGGMGRITRDTNGSIFAHATAGKRVMYQVTTREPPRDLAADLAAPPREHGENYLQLPPLDPRVAELARAASAGARSDAGRALALAEFLRARGRYTDTPPPLAEGTSPIEQFLLERSEGHCEYFASGLVVLLRSVGIPARLVNGYAGGHANELGDFIEVAQSDAHAWVEVHYAHAGWVAYDATPADLRLAGADALRGLGSISDLASALELWWFRNVVDFDRGHQARALRALWMGWNRWRAAQRGTAPEDTQPHPGGSARGLPWRWLGALAALGLAGALARRRWARASGPPLPRDYARALRLLRRHGLARGPATSARAFAAAVAASIPADGAAAFRALTEAYLAERFGARRAAAPPGALQALRASLRSRVSAPPSRDAAAAARARR